MTGFALWHMLEPGEKMFIENLSKLEPFLKEMTEPGQHCNKMAAGTDHSVEIIWMHQYPTMKATKSGDYYITSEKIHYFNRLIESRIRYSAWVQLLKLYPSVPTCEFICFFKRILL